MSVSNSAVAKPDLRARRAAQAEKYAPRQVVRQAPATPVEDIRLRKLLAQTLDALKRPDAIPSRILMDSLVQAKALGATK